MKKDNLKYKTLAVIGAFSIALFAACSSRQPNSAEIVSQCTAKRVSSFILNSSPDYKVDYFSRFGADVHISRTISANGVSETVIRSNGQIIIPKQVNESFVFPIISSGGKLIGDLTISFNNPDSFVLNSCAENGLEG